MARFEWDEFGQRYYIDEDGNETLSPGGAGYPELLGKELTDIGSNVSRLWREEADVDAELQAREALFSGAEAESPLTAMAASMSPGLATLPITAGTALGTFGLNVGLSAAESALSYDPNASAGQRAIAGGTAGLMGDLLGRSIGRVLEGAKGLAADMLAPRRAAVNPNAAALEDMGGDTLAFQRMEQGSQAQDLALRGAQADQASGNPSGVMRQVLEQQEGVSRSFVDDAVGGTGAPPKLDRAWRKETLARFNQQYSAVADELDAAGGLQISTDLADVLRDNTAVKKLLRYNKLPGLKGDGTTLNGKEWKQVREALADDAAHEMTTNATVGGVAYEFLDELDDVVRGVLPDEFLGDYARLREQNRVFKILERPNVIAPDGQINMRSLAQKLDSASTGFGRTATAGNKATTNPETQKLLDWVEVAGEPEFSKFRSSGTAENLAQRDMVSDIVDSTMSFAGTGNPLPAVGTMMKLKAPAVNRAAQTGSGEMFEALATDTPKIYPHITGRGAGSLLDEALYPFVGVQDERAQQ